MWYIRARASTVCVYLIVMVEEGSILHVLPFLLATVLTDIEVASSVTQPVT